MLPDRALKATFRNFSTLFLLAALVTLTAHLVYGFIFRDVLEVDELHRFVKGLTPGRTVNGVGRSDLDAAVTWSRAVVAVEILLLPLLICAARRAMDRDEWGEVPTVIDALRHPRSGARLSFRFSGGELGTVLFGAVLGVATWLLTVQLGLLIAEPLPDPWNFLSFSLAYGVAEALGLTFFLGALITAGRAAGRRRSQPRAAAST